MKNTHIDLKKLIPVILLLLLWIVPFFIPYKYASMNICFFLSFCLIPLLLLTAAYIVEVISFKKTDKTKTRMKSTAIVLVVVAVVCAGYTVYKAYKNTNTEKFLQRSEVLSKSIDCEVFIDEKEDSLTKYVSTPDTTGQRPSSPKDCTMSFFYNTFEYYEDLNMTFYKNKDDTDVCNFEISLYCVSDCPSFFSKVLKQSVLREIKNKNASFNENNETYVSEDGYECISFYSRRTSAEEHNRYIVLISKDDKLLVADMAVFFKDVDFDTRNIDTYFVNILNEI